jgi:glycosyltransferase involved in cell wall biosynthesis
MVERDGCRMRIAIIAPPWFEVPPRAYGGIETICAGLVDQLVSRGHDVTLIGAGRHRTAGRFIPTLPEPPSARLGEPLPELLHAALAARALETLDIDLVHDHTLTGLLLASGRTIPTVVTAHGPVQGEVGDYYRALDDRIALVAISDAQRQSAPDLPWLGTVSNGIDVGDYPFRSDKENYALWLGRFSPEKGAHLAIDAARAAGRPLVLAGKCSEPAERQYFLTEISPRLGPDLWIFGEADHAMKRELLAGAACLVFPVCWDEPFGIVMVEAMACGTPVVALRRGSVPEIVVDGVTGFVCDDPRGLSRAIAQVSSLDSRRCRAHVCDRFHAAAMGARYEAIYRRVLNEKGKADALDAGRLRRLAHYPVRTAPLGSALE